MPKPAGFSWTQAANHGSCPFSSDAGKKSGGDGSGKTDVKLKGNAYSVDSNGKPSGSCDSYWTSGHKDYCRKRMDRLLGAENHSKKK